MIIEVPNKFAAGIKIAFSDVSDGSMASGGGSPSSLEHAQNVDKFLNTHNLPSDHSRVYVTYGDSHTYTQVVRLTPDNHPQTIECDALYTTEAGYVVTLPVADCVATVVYDPVSQMLGVLHLGRHASMAGLIESFVIEVADNVGSDPRDWYVWLSPSLRQANDGLDYFTPPNPSDWASYMTKIDSKIHIDTIGYIRSRFIRAGVDTMYIEQSTADTYLDKSYFSNRAANENNDPTRQGRMMVAAQLLG